LIDHPGASGGEHCRVGVAVDDFGGALFHAAFVGADAGAVAPGGAAEVAELGFAAAALGEVSISRVVRTGRSSWNGSEETYVMW
jgi:hypothetical protein